ncbi:MAG: cysteine desulfurase [Clostridia bacterium]|nr:cysteine desulfurase [Clostridia bacterium]
MTKKVYLDYAASTPLKKEVLEVMIPYMTEHYGNASSVHLFGRNMHQALENSRRKIAQIINAGHDEIYFTASGTEGDNWILKGLFKKHPEKKHLIIASFEHPAILNTAKELEEEGIEVTYINPESNGIVDPEKIELAIRKDTLLVSVMYVNNELGTVQPVGKIGKICHKYEVLFHTDAVQAFGYFPIDVKRKHIDLMTMSSHKIYGPMGIGAVYIRRGIKIKPLLSGGAQERKRRAGTSNVAAAVGFAEAARLRYTEFETNINNLVKKKNYLLDALIKLEGVKLNAESEHPGTFNLQIENVSGEILLMNLDLKGIAVSSGSACSSGSLNPSHVLLSIGLSEKEVKSSIRISVGDLTTFEDLDYVIESFKEILNRLR